MDLFEMINIVGLMQETVQAIEKANTFDEMEEVVTRFKMEIRAKRCSIPLLSVLI